MKFGLSETEYKQLKGILERNLPQGGRGIRLWVFGSRARGDHKRYSDLDLLIESPIPLSTEELSIVKNALEESSFPLKVDLVQEKDLAESYRAGIFAERIPFGP